LTKPWCRLHAGLPLLAVPEQHHVDLAWLDVVGDVGGGSDTAGRFAIQAQRVRSLGGSSSGGWEWIVAEPRLIIAVEIELMRTRNPRGIIAELQLRRPVCEGGMRGEVMIK
jgi:hypothetical protein